MLAHHLVLALNFTGTKAIIVYVVVILAIIAFGVYSYSRRGPTRS